MTAIQKQQEKKELSIVEQVQLRVDKLEKLGELTLPHDYNAANAIRAAWLDLEEMKDKNNQLVVNVATRASIIKSLFKMVVMGLSVAKGQGAFILYGQKLTFQPEYHGNILLGKRWAGVKKVNHHTIYEGDEVELFIDEEGNKKVVHRPKFDNIDLTKIKGAYCVVIFEDGSRRDEVLTKDQITKAWLQGPMKGQSPAHKNFPDAMSEKSVVNRIMTRLYKQSNDGAIVEKIERMEDEEMLANSAKPVLPVESRNVSFDDAVEVEDVHQAEETPEQEPEPTPEPPKKESKVEVPKAKEKAVKQPETLFDEDNDNGKEPF